MSLEILLDMKTVCLSNNSDFLKHSIVIFFLPITVYLLHLSSFSNLKKNVS